MITALKWIVAALVAVITWFFVELTVEYFSPYRQIRIPRLRNRS